MNDWKEIRKRKWKKNLVRIGFILLLLATIYLVSSILKVKSAHGIDQKEGLYWQPENTIDIAMMGTSHVHCGINTGLLWEKYGIASYDYSGAEQPLWMTYFYLRELYKYQTPKVIVLDVYAPARYKEDFQYDWISENIYGMKFSANKMAMLFVSVELDRMFEYFPSFMVYHDRYDDLGADDFNSFFWNAQEKVAFKGYTPYWERTAYEKPQISEDRNDGLTEKSERYLRKIIEYTREKGSELVLVVIPYVMTAEDKRAYNRITEIAAEEGLIFINYNEYTEDMGLDYQTDLNDDSHLNYWGSCKFTDYLGGFLDSYEGAPDRRGQAGYESWDENARLIREEQEQMEQE